MSGGQDVLGMVAGGASLLSLSVQLAESAATLKGLYHDTRDAPEALNVLAHGIETVSLDLKLIERKRQSEACGADLLNQCLENCQRHAEEIQQLTNQLSLKLGEVFLSGMFDTLVREQVPDTLLDDLDHAQNTLQQDVLEFHGQEMARRWRLRTTGGVQPRRGHEYSDIAVREHISVMFTSPTMALRPKRLSHIFSYLPRHYKSGEESLSVHYTAAKICFTSATNEALPCKGQFRRTQIS
jgi:hypothetical protein